MKTTGTLALLLGLCVTQSSRAELVWDRTSLVSDRGGLAAVLADPDDGQVAWAASETRVWVTDDGGDAWYLVAQIHGNRRTQTSTQAEQEEDVDSGSTDEADDLDEFEPSFDSLAPVEDLESGVAQPGMLRSGPTTTESVTPPVVRLRLVAGQVFLTGDRGLWAIDRAARTLGTAVEVRLGRAMAVRDLVAAPWGPILIGTNQGLREIGDDGGVRRSSRGALGDRDVACLVVSGDVVLAATGEGLWRVSGGGATRMGLVGVSRPRELLALPAGPVALATATEMMFVDPRTEQVIQRRPLSRIERLSRDRSGRVWAVGVDGAWTWTSSGSGEEDEANWKRRTHGLGDRRLTDVAGTVSGDGHLFAVGRGGVWRRVPERVWLAHRRERLTDVAVEEGGSPVWELLEAAHAAHFSTESRITYMRRAGQWAFTLPEVRVEYQYRARREEDIIQVPELERGLVTQVRVYPQGHYLRVMALWNLYPVIWGLFETDNPYSGPTVAEETVRALTTRNQIQSAVVGLYNLWAQRRRAWREGAPPSAHQALKAILSLQHIEADLHVLTDGSFTSMTTLDSISKGGNP